MRIKLDENIAASASVRLTALGHDVHTVIEEVLSGRGDSEVWAAAQLEERFLITQDLESLASRSSILRQLFGNSG